MEIKLDKKSYVPLSRQIIDIITERIIKKEYKIGEAIPSQAALQKEFGVSLITVRNALKELLAKGIIETNTGKHTTVKQIPPLSSRNKYHTLKGFTADKAHTHTHSVVSTIKTSTGSQHVRDILKLQKKENITIINRKRIKKNAVITVETSYLNSAFFSNINWKSQFTDGVSLYTLIQNNSDIKISSAEEEIDAVLCPNKHLSLFNVPQNTPLLSIKRITYAKNIERPFEYCEYLTLPEYYGTITLSPT